MVTQKKATGRASSIPAGLALGAAASILSTAIICMIGSWMIGEEIIRQEQIGYCSIITLIASSMTGSLIAWRKIRRKRLLVSFASGLIYYLILIAITVVFFDGQFQGLGVTLITIIIGVNVTILLTNGGPKGKKRMQRQKNISVSCTKLQTG